MNWAHVHLMLNHLPLHGAIAGTVLLGLSIAMKRQAVARAGFVVIVVTAILAGAVYWTGEPTEELVESLPGVSESFIERHEEMALVAAIAAAAVGLFALYGLVALRRGGAPLIVGIAFLLSLLPFGAMAYTAYLGGQIRHSEIRSDAGETGNGARP